MKRTVLLVGAGEIARRVHLPRLARDPNVARVSVADENLEVAEATAAEWGLDLLRGSLEDSPADLVVICTPPATHASLALRALGAGKDVVVEKPLAMSGADAREVRRTADRLGRTLHVCHTPAFRPDVAAAMDFVRSGALGKVGEVDVSWTRNAGLPGTPGGLSAGVVWDLGAHVTHLAVSCATRVPLTPGWSVTALAHRPVNPADTTALWYSNSADTTQLSVSQAPVMAAFDGTALLAEGTVLRVRAGWHGATGDDLVTARVRGTHGELHLRALFGFSPTRARMKGPAVVVEDLRTGNRRTLVRRQIRRPIEYDAQWDAHWAASDDDVLSAAVSTAELCEGFERTARNSLVGVGI